METLGTLPTQLRAVLMLLLAKPKGGFRPIGLFSSIYRLWAKARRPYAVAWEEAHWKPYFACGAGRGAEDTVWRQAVKAESGVATEKEA
eukprot:14322770-Heterocapsa_arctica.AAC.1